jgi:hypothetical protein
LFSQSGRPQISEVFPVSSAFSYSVTLESASNSDGSSLSISTTVSNRLIASESVSSDAIISDSSSLGESISSNAKLSDSSSLSESTSSNAKLSDSSSVSESISSVSTISDSSDLSQSISSNAKLSDSSSLSESIGSDSPVSDGSSDSWISTISVHISGFDQSSPSLPFPVSSLLRVSHALLHTVVFPASRLFTPTLRLSFSHPFSSSKTLLPIIIITSPSSRSFTDSSKFTLFTSRPFSASLTPRPTRNPDSGQGSNTSPGLIAGVTVGILVVIAAIVIGFLILRRQESEGSEMPPAETEFSTCTTESSTFDDDIIEHEYLNPITSIGEVEVAPEEDEDGKFNIFE